MSETPFAVRAGTMPRDLEAYSQSITRLLAPYLGQPDVGSKAEQECSDPTFGAFARDAHCGGLLSLQVVLDHLMALPDMFSPPASTLAPCTCARGLLESAALGTWLLDPMIDLRERTSRYLAFRYEGLVQQSKLPGTDGVRDRIVKVEQDAMKLGYKQLRDKRNRISGVGQPMPSTTSLIRDVLDHETEYRILSGVAHGHHWLMHQVGFEVFEIDTLRASGPFIRKVLRPEMVLWIGLIAVRNCNFVLCNLWLLFGWDWDELTDVLDTTGDHIGLTEPLRIWRTIAT